MADVFRKLKNKSGETLTEVLVASLVACLGVVLFATMVSSSFHVLTMSEEKMQAFYAQENLAEKKDSPLATNVAIEINHPVDVTGICMSNDFSESNVSIYGGDEILSYAKE